MQVFLFDIDGVLIRVDKYYSSVLENEGFTGAIASLNAFHNGPENTACLVGAKSPLLAIKPFLESIGWSKSTEEYFKGQFEYESKYLDHELLTIIEKLRTSGKKCYLATDQDAFRSGFLLHQLGFNTLFDGWFISSQIGARKIDRKYWTKVFEKLEAELKLKCKTEILFIDDNRQNIQVASEVGLGCFYVSSNDDIELLKKHLIMESDFEDRR